MKLILKCALFRSVRWHSPPSPKIVKRIQPLQVRLIKKVSYALGMNLALQRKRTDADVDINAFAQGLEDVTLDGKPTQITESEVPEILNQARTDRLDEKGNAHKEKVAYALGMRMAGQFKARHRRRRQQNNYSRDERRA
mgnify:CR=1 FL=1